MLMDHDPAAVVPRRQQDAAVATFVLDVLERADEVGDAAEAEAAADKSGPGTIAQVSFDFSFGLLMFCAEQARL